MQLFPAEKMLAAIDPGYEMSEVSAQLDLQIQNGSLHVMQYNADALDGRGVVGRALRSVLRLPAREGIPAALQPHAHRRQEAFSARAAEGLQDVRARQKKPNIAILEFRDPTGRSEYEIYRDYFRPKVIRPNWFRPISWNIATACCAAAPSTSI
jgi:hypothetical protein